MDVVGGQVVGPDHRGLLARGEVGGDDDLAEAHVDQVAVVALSLDEGDPKELGEVRALVEQALDERKLALAQAPVGLVALDPADPAKVLARTEEPLMAPETEEERAGTVPNVVFPTAIEEIDGRLYVFYGMADAHIGVALLERTA